MKDISDIDRSYRFVNVWLGVVCLVIFLSLTTLVINNSIEKVNDKLEQESSKTHAQLIELLRSSEYVMDGFSAYFHTVDEVNYQRLEDYSKTIRNQYPHIYMTQYMVRVQRNELDDFIAERKNEGYATYRVTEFKDDTNSTLVAAGDRGVYYPLVFMDPLMVRSLPMLGYDVYSLPVIRDAIDRSIELGINYSTLPFNMKEGGLGYMVIRPIYTSDIPPEDIETRHKMATRIVAALIRIDDLIHNIDVNDNYSLSLYRTDNNSTVYTVGRKNTDAINETILLPIYQHALPFQIAGQPFHILLQRQLTLNDLDYEWIAFSLIATIAISLLIFNFVHLRIASAKERHRAQIELFREKELAEVTLHSIGEAVITTDMSFTVKFINPAASTLTGWRLEDAINQPLDNIFKLISESDRDPVKSTVYECLEKGSTTTLDEHTLLINKHGDEFAIENSSAPIHNHSGELIGAVLIFRNITNIRSLSKKMEFQATHDALTELINRREFEHQLKNAVISAREEDKKHALCYLDLDQFKIVNDTCGHIAGDQLLRELAKLMPHNIRASDCLARLGGDEFGVLMFDCPLIQAEKVADNLRAAIKDFTFTWDKKNFDVGVSIGLVPIEKESGSLQDILRRADSACYIAKDFGRNRIHVYKPDDYELAKRKGEMQWVTKIQKALDENRFQLALQPLKPLSKSSSKLHQEVLIRMKDEDNNIISPMTFIPAAERYDLMPTLDRWVISTSFKYISDEKNAGSLDTIYNINLSGQTLCDNTILSFINTELKKYNIPANSICFEITETAVIANLGLAVEFINEMKAEGFSFALDDFGSGLSSFTYLKKLPVDYLKIDGEFVRDILHDKMDRAIVSAINDIGHEMGLMTVAEYVENENILNLLKNLGVDYVQGYGVEKPKTWIVDNVVQFNTKG